IYENIENPTQLKKQATMKIKLLLIILSVFATHSAFAKNDEQTQRQFYQTIKSLCGKTFHGKTLFPEDPDHDFAGKTLAMTLAKCTEQEIRIPFKVGEDTSRTWILSNTDKGLLFKHDHRHADGTPDEVTMYGGYTNDKGTTLSQSFAADEYTAKLIPEAKTNVWTVYFNQEQTQLFYYLERHGKPRYKAVFELGGG
ncbi:MAG: hypothetical protein OEY96_12810, partial [Gammaproteobacteria bacterium]|nr:hypothetical protein [Gammaproteobacteria bacterium]